MTCSTAVVSIKIKKGLCWSMLCIVIFLISFFIHECGHGLANSLRGINCSTGFNRVGDSFKYPNDIDFREEYSSSETGLLDFGVPATLSLAIVGTIGFYKTKRRGKIICLAFAITNSLIRLIPCVCVILIPLITSKTHVEDEYETGLVLARITKISGTVYFPAILSILISIICIVFLLNRLKTSVSVRAVWGYGLLTFVSFGVAVMIANMLDNIIRINWVGMIT